MKLVLCSLLASALLMLESFVNGMFVDAIRPDLEAKALLGYFPRLVPLMYHLVLKKHLSLTIAVSDAL